MRTSSLILSAACFCLTGAAVAKDFDHDFAGEKPAVQTADRLEWAWDGDDHFSVGGRAIVHYQKAIAQYNGIGSLTVSPQHSETLTY